MVISILYPQKNLILSILALLTSFVDDSLLMSQQIAADLRSAKRVAQIDRYSRHDSYDLTPYPYPNPYPVPYEDQKGLILLSLHVQDKHHRGTVRDLAPDG